MTVTAAVFEFFAFVVVVVVVVIVAALFDTFELANGAPTATEDEVTDRRGFGGDI
jgi:hypothetical protein